MKTGVPREQAAMEFCKKGLPFVVVNPTGVIGERDIKSTPSGQIILKVINRKYLGYPDGGTNFVDVEDVARGHFLTVKKGRIGERYILDNTNMAYKDFFKLVSEVAGVSALIRRMPAGALITLGYLQFLSAITRKPPLTTGRGARFACQYAYYDCSKAVKELGMPKLTSGRRWRKLSGGSKRTGMSKTAPRHSYASNLSMP